MFVNDGRLSWLRYAPTYFYRVISNDPCLCTYFSEIRVRSSKAVENIVVLNHDPLGTIWSGKLEFSLHSSLVVLSPSSCSKCLWKFRMFV